MWGNWKGYVCLGLCKICKMKQLKNKRKDLNENEEIGVVSDSDSDNSGRLCVVCCELVEKVKNLKKERDSLLKGR